jgi:hypothetical protein
MIDGRGAFEAFFDDCVYGRCTAVCVLSIAVGLVGARVHDAGAVLVGLGGFLLCSSILGMGFLISMIEWSAIPKR